MSLLTSPPPVQCDVTEHEGAAFRKRTAGLSLESDPRAGPGRSTDEIRLSAGKDLYRILGAATPLTRQESTTVDQQHNPTAREGLVVDAVTKWTKDLVDLGSRNTLLYYRDLAVGTISLEQAEPLALTSLLAGGRTVRRSHHR